MCHHLKIIWVVFKREKSNLFKWIFSSTTCPLVDKIKEFKKILAPLPSGVAKEMSLGMLGRAG